MLNPIGSSILKLCLGLLILNGGPAHSNELHILSLNLHGYHPMGEAPRVIEEPAGRFYAANSDLFFFERQELKRGHKKRLDELSEILKQKKPDMILLQEVGAGDSLSKATCTEFYSAPETDHYESNSAHRLNLRLAEAGLNYSLRLACRGNVGWWTTSNTFQNRRIWKQIRGRRELVFDYGSNPYPNGVIVEGTGILIHPSWNIRDHLIWNLPINSIGDKFFVQGIAFSQSSVRQSKWYLVFNLHAGHKVVHFEQAVALQNAILNYVRTSTDRQNFGGVIIGGDLNAQLYRPSSQSGEISFVPWEIAVKNEFDFIFRGRPLSDLVHQLIELNEDSTYKPWANIQNREEARRRIESAVTTFETYQKDFLAEGLQGREVLSYASQLGLCHARAERQESCQLANRIDHIVATQKLEPKEARIIFTDNNWQDPQGISDHPGIEAILKLQ